MKKQIRLGNILNEEYSSGYAGNVWAVCGLAPTLKTNQGGYCEPMVVVKSCAMRGRESQNKNTEQRLEIGGDVANAITTVQKDSLVLEIQVGEENEEKVCM